MATRRAPLHQVEPPPAADDQVRVVFTGDDEQLDDYLAELLVQLLDQTPARE
jgi:hypothetical protein